ncbi:prolipoprotein diacylglyceryl transferase [Peptostreptococcus sp.]
MDRVAFSFFGLDIMWYGILIACGILMAILVSSKEARRLGYQEGQVTDICLFAIPLGIVGARLYYVAFNWSQYAGDLREIINIRGGGLAIHGGILAGILTVWVFTRIKKLEFFRTADILVLGLPMAQAIGRWGNFINGEAHGGPTNLPWAILVEGQRVHPTFLYESVWDWMIFVYIFMIRKNKKYEGQLLVDYIFLYSLGRFFIEGLRTDSLMLGPIKMAQLISLVGIGMALVARYFLLKKKAYKENTGK